MNFDENVLIEILELFVKKPDISGTAPYQRSGRGTAQSIAFRLTKSWREIEPVLEFLVKAEVLKIMPGQTELRVYQSVKSPYQEKTNAA